MLRSREARCVRHVSLGALVLSARIVFAVCGDGVLESGEGCDDGNLVAGDCCDPSCAAEPAGSACPDDGNPCSLDECDGAAVCTHPAGSTAPCDDGDPCTTNDLCGDGVCAGSVVPETCIDPVICRSARASALNVGPIGVDDGVALFIAPVRRTTALCLPASTTGGTPIDPDTVLVSYRTRLGAIGARLSWLVSDQFGVVGIESGGAAGFMLASGANLVPPPPAPPPPGSANHYSCRKARLVPGSVSPAGTAVTIDDALGTHAGVIGRPRRLCLPADVDAPGTGMEHRRTALLCYQLRPADVTFGPVLARETASQLGSSSVTAFRSRELCVPAAAIRPASPCLTSRDECGLPCCRDYPGQSALCTYDPALPDPRYLGCGGPTILFDRTHANFHQVTPESGRNPGRFWGFAKLLTRDGYVVRDSTTPFAALFPAVPAKILVIANPRSLIGSVAIPPPDADAVVDWVEQGGSLLVSIDHSPFDRTDDLLAGFGLEQFGRNAMTFTFTIANGGLNTGSPIAAGIGEVTTFTGTAFRVATALPLATYDPVLTFPPGSPNGADGWHQAMAIQFGLGRVFVSAESGGLTAQDSFGMHETPDNEQYVRNVVHWLDF